MCIYERMNSMKKKEIKSFKDAWKLPFKKDPEGLAVYIWDSENHVCFNYLGESYEKYCRIVDLLNGVDGAVPFKGVGRDDQHIAATDDVTEDTARPCLFVRGWGHLTGGGALNLPYEKAVELQNGLIDYCVNKLHGKNE